MIYKFNHTFHTGGSDYVDMKEAEKIISNLIYAGDLLKNCTFKPYDQFTKAEIDALNYWEELKDKIRK